MMKICAYVLCRNEECWLPMSLASIEPVCDKIFLIDNGSEDRSVEIAEEVGCEIIQMPGTGFDDPKSREQDLRDRGIRACLEEGADLILRWDADEILYESQEGLIRDAIKDDSIGAWKFRCDRFISDFSWVSDVREGEPGFMEDGSYDLIGYGRQTGEGKIVLFRSNPRLSYVVDPHYVGLHSSEFNSVVPHTMKSLDCWYIHAEYCRSNERLYRKAIMYYDLISDPKDWAHTEEFRSMIDSENVFTPLGPIHGTWHVRPWGLRKREEGLPKYVKGLELPVNTIVEEDEGGRLFIKRREWYGDSEI